MGITREVDRAVWYGTVQYCTVKVLSGAYFTGPLFLPYHMQLACRCRSTALSILPLHDDSGVAGFPTYPRQALCTTLYVLIAHLIEFTIHTRPTSPTTEIALAALSSF